MKKPQQRPRFVRLYICCLLLFRAQGRQCSWIMFHLHSLPTRPLATVDSVSFFDKRSIRRETHRRQQLVSREIFNFPTCASIQLGGEISVFVWEFSFYFSSLKSCVCKCVYIFHITFGSDFDSVFLPSLSLSEHTRKAEKLANWLERALCIESRVSDKLYWESIL